MKHNRTTTDRIIHFLRTFPNAGRLIVLQLVLGLVITAMPLFGTSSATAAAELTGLTAMEITTMMGKGFNIGNTFDANGGNSKDIYSQETSWGNAQVSRELMHGIAEAGFKTVRIPITWYRHISTDGTYTVAPEWMARIKEVVDYAYEEGLFVIINAHHEPWINKAGLADDQVAVGDELCALWAQIADAFADYDQHLIFEAMNEPRAAGTGYEWTGTKKEYDAINYLNQRFAETIRTNPKGHNDERCLMIPDYAASATTAVINSLVIPQINGEQLNNVIFSVHCYAPYDFCLSDKQISFNPKNSTDTAAITTLISIIRNNFMSKGIPAVIGECGCTNTKNNNDARAAWFRFFGTKTEEAGIPAIVWDNGAGGTSGGECHRYIDRKTGKNLTPELTDAFIYGKEAIKTGSDNVIDFEPYVLDGAKTAVVLSEVGFTSPKLQLQPRVNHTEGAAIGYSVKCDPGISGENIFFDLTSYKGEQVTITAWLNTADDRITMGITDNRDAELPHGTSEITDDSVTRHSADVKGEWVQLSFTGKLPNKKGIYLFFRAENGSTFNIDDLCITLGAPADPAGFVASALMISEGITAPDDKPDANNTIPVTTDSSTASAASGSEGESSDASGQTAQKSNSTAVVCIVVASICVIVLGIAVILYFRSKKTK